MTTVRSLRQIVTTFVGVGLLVPGAVGCDVGAERRGAPPTVETPPLWAVIPFERGECDTLDRLPIEVERLLQRVGGPLSSSLLVMGYANELPDLKDNLKIAEDRAHAVVKRLQLRGISRDRIQVAWSEAPRDDSQGSRVEVILLRNPKRLV
jgi:hypothetical protein